MSFPESFETARLRAERLRPEHAAEIHRMHQCAEQMALLGGLRDETQTAVYMARNLAHWETFGFGIWLIHDRDTQQVAGRALLRHVAIDGIDEIEVGYGFFPEYWGRGIAAEIAGTCLEHGRNTLGLRSIVAITLPENLRSQRVMEKIGMVYERTIQHDRIPHVLFRTATTNTS